MGYLNLLVVLVFYVNVSGAAVVATSEGLVEGFGINGTVVYRGLPYAAPPTGELRWRPPATPVSWEGIRNATEFGAACPQDFADDSVQWRKDHINSIGTDEDCLTLNIWAPADALPGSLPVLVYFHGGNMKWGTGSHPAYDGGVLANAGFVVVTLNYRLGLLGRFAHPALTRQQSGEPLANYGVMDQIAALKWVRKNIGAFGGNADEVTIFGHSAGGVSVNVLMITPDSAGLFSRAIAQGSAILIDRTRHAFERGNGGLAAGSLEDLGTEIANNFNISGDDEKVVAELKALTSEQLVSYVASRKDIELNPVVDGVVVPGDIAVMFETGRQRNVPYMGGANSWEYSQLVNIPLIGKWFLADDLLAGLSDEDLSVFSDQWTRIGVSRRWFEEGMFLMSTRYLAKQMSAVSSPAFLYHLSYVQKNLRGEIPGAPHGLEVAFLFGNVFEHPEFQRPEQVPLTEDDREFAASIRAYWLNFARTGNPNGSGLPNWPEYQGASDILMNLGDPFAAEANFNKATLDFLEQRALVRRASFSSD